MDRSDVDAAARRIAGQIVRTPTLRSPVLDEAAGVELWFKCENLQRIGAFKARGALHAVGRLDPEVRARGVITYSSGNHAQAVALAAHLHGIPATIAMPVDAPEIKVDGVKRLGATVVPAGYTSNDRKKVAEQIELETGGTIISPFNDPDIVAGQGTATLELVEDVKAATGDTLDALLVPVGGGGLIAGACLVCAQTPTRIYSVEPTTCDAMARSLEAGHLVDVEPGPTLADGLKPVRIGDLNFEIAREHVAGALRVDDEEIGLALVRLLIRLKVCVEPSGAAAAAAALRGGLPGSPRRVGVLLSGGNVAPQVVADLLARYASRA